MMIKYRMKPKLVEIEYSTGLELKYITQLLTMIDVLNEVKSNEQKANRNNR